MARRGREGPALLRPEPILEESKLCPASQAHRGDRSPPWDASNLARTRWIGRKVGAQGDHPSLASISSVVYVIIIRSIYPSLWVIWGLFSLNFLDH